MKLIKPSYKILTSQSDLKDIELAGRTCYQSSEKISEDETSAKLFVSNIVKRKHFAMLEFAPNFIFIVDKQLLIDLLLLSHKTFFKFFNITSSNTRHILSCNMRCGLEFIEYINYNKVMYGEYKTIAKLYDSIYSRLPIELKCLYIIPANKYNSFLYPILTQKELMSEIEKEVHETVTVKLIVDRGILAEITRHRLMSFAVKSTRYCDENVDIEFIEPLWIADLNGEEIYKTVLRGIELYYHNLREFDWKPEQARSILPNSLKTEIVMKGSLREYKTIFKLRCDKSAHPQFREISIPLREEFKKIYPEIDFH